MARFAKYKKKTGGEATSWGDFKDPSKDASGNKHADSAGVSAKKLKERERRRLRRSKG